MDTTRSHPTWPALPLLEWEDTLGALHRAMQVVGKLKLACTPWTNHSWHVALSLTARGITTGPMPCGSRFLQADFDFLDHQLKFVTSEGASDVVPLQPQSVAKFYALVRETLHRLDMPFEIRTLPCEIPEAVPFELDTLQRPYEADAVQRFWRILLQVDRVMRVFRARFRGKNSPIHFFWGAMDLAVTRFSGRKAPPHPGGVPHLADWVVREAYSDEVSSCGFWPGPGLGYPAFYAYAYPEPEGFAEAELRHAAVFYSKALREFILPYDAVREAANPDAVLLDFLQSTYELAAERARWNRAALECAVVREVE
jgi:hypothetical protein